MLNDTFDLLNVIKGIAVRAVKAEEPAEIQYGNVASLDPFIVDVGEYTLEDDFLTMTRTIKGMLNKEPCCGSCNDGAGTKCRFGSIEEGDVVALLKDAGGDNWLVIDVVEAEEDE